MLFQNLNNCPTNISDLLWQLTIKAVNDARSKKQTLQQEPRGRFSVQLLRTENRHVPDCLQSKVFWVVHRPETPASDCLGGWMVYRPPYPIITQQNIHFKAWIFPLNTVDSLIFFYLYVADILIQYICWNHWKNWKIIDSRCRFLTRPIWPF